MEFFEARGFRLEVENGNSATLRGGPSSGALEIGLFPCVWCLACQQKVMRCFVRMASTLVIKCQIFLPFVGASQYMVELEYEVMYMQLAAFLNPAEEFWTSWPKREAVKGKYLFFYLKMFSLNQNIYSVCLY